MTEAVRDKLIVALDVPTMAEAEALVERLKGHVGVYKIGLELIYVGGIELARHLAADGENVFLDTKLHDIPHTVERSVARIADLGVRYITLHAQDTKMLEAAAQALPDGNRLQLLGVTVLTSLSADDLRAGGMAMAPADLVTLRARLACEAGCHGVVASGQEASAVRAAIGPRPHIVTPGIRPAGADAGDQARVMTPAAAIAAGASHLVVGRPITRADDPAAAADAIVAEISGV